MWRLTSKLLKEGQRLWSRSRHYSFFMSMRLQHNCDWGRAGHIWQWFSEILWIAMRPKSWLWSQIWFKNLDDKKKIHDYTLSRSLIEPFPLIYTRQPVVASTRFNELPLGPSSRPTKLNWKYKIAFSLGNSKINRM